MSVTATPLVKVTPWTAGLARASGWHSASSGHGVAASAIRAGGKGKRSAFLNLIQTGEDIGTDKGRTDRLGIGQSLTDHRGPYRVVSYRNGRRICWLARESLRYETPANDARTTSMGMTSNNGSPRHLLKLPAQIKCRDRLILGMSHAAPAANLLRRGSEAAKRIQQQMTSNVPARIGGIDGQTR